MRRVETARSPIAAAATTSAKMLSGSEYAPVMVRIQHSEPQVKEAEVDQLAGRLSEHHRGRQERVPTVMTCVEPGIACVTGTREATQRATADRDAV